MLFSSILKYSMNYKLEKFWNRVHKANIISDRTMNYKLEKFWNYSIEL